MELTRQGGTSNFTAWEPKKALPATVAAITGFLDTVSTSFGRATAYNSREEQQAAELKVHRDFLAFDRELYTLILLLPAVTDHAKQVGLRNLLVAAPDDYSLAPKVLTRSLELSAVYILAKQLPPQRMLKLFASLRHGSELEGFRRLNNSRTRKLMLRTILGSPKIELWSVKYRSKIQEILRHAWGQRNTSILLSILAKKNSSGRENKFVHQQIVRYAGEGANLKKVYASIRFAFGEEEKSLPLFKAFYAAQKDLSKGAKLPLEVLEGIRSTYHKNVSSEEVLRIAKGSLTKGQKLSVQRKAEKAGVEVELDFADYDAIRLYLYAYERGMNEEIEKALDKKARESANSFPIAFAKVGVVVDASKSMEGSKTQPLRPMAAALALRDMLETVATEKYYGLFAGGAECDGRLVQPSGHTAIAEKYLLVLAQKPDVVFVISDGYENAPAGRFQKAVDAVQSLKIPELDIPIYQMNPVFAAESKGVRKLANQAIVLPANNPKLLAMSIVRGLLESNPVRAVNLMLSLSMKVLQGGG